MPDKRESGVKQVMTDLSCVQLCSMCHAKEAGVLLISVQPGPCEIMWSRDLPASTPGTNPPPTRPLQIQSTCSLQERWTNCTLQTLFLLRFEPKPTKTPSSMFRFVSWNYTIFVLDPELKQSGNQKTETSQNEDQQGKERQIRAKQSETLLN